MAKKKHLLAGLCWGLCSRPKSPKGSAGPHGGYGAPHDAALTGNNTGTSTTDTSTPHAAEPEPEPVMPQAAPVTERSEQATAPSPIVLASADQAVAPPSTMPTPAEQATAPSPVPRPAASTSSESEHLWDRAYEKLRSDRSDLVDHYQTIISHELSYSETQNTVPQNRAERQLQMVHLLDIGLEKTAKLAKVEKKLGDAIDVVLSVKESVGSSLQAVPVAAIAWTGICVALQVSLPARYPSA